MRLSLLQPRIVRGDIEHNLAVIHRLVDRSKGDLLVLPEYALTRSLVLDLEADVHDWALRSANAKALINVPKGKHLLINTLAEFDGKLRNCCELLPLGELQFKLFPDQTELDAGILTGTEQKIFSALGCLEILGLMWVVWFFFADGDLFGLCTWCTPVFVFVFRFCVPCVILWFVEPEFLSDKSFSPHN